MSFWDGQHELSRACLFDALSRAIGALLYGAARPLSPTGGWKASLVSVSHLVESWAGALRFSSARYRSAFTR